MEHAILDGEVIETTDGNRSPLQIALSELAAFKFKLVETVAADPRLSKAPCAAAIVVLMSFVTIDKRTLKPTPAYASTITLMVRGGMSRRLAKLARKLLVENGYLKATGSKTKDGCLKYALENPHVERVAMHIQEAAEYLKERAAEERKEERRKAGQDRSEPDVGSDMDHTQNDCGVHSDPDVGSDMDPNYLRTYLSSLGTEERDIPIKVSSTPALAYGQDDDPDLPYPIPETAEELQAMLEEFQQAGLSFVVIGGFRANLMAGTLTPAMVEEQLRLAS